MARPKIPLISRRAALQAALDIIDSEGLDALSIRRLGEALNVNGASLYHHFKNKDDILIGVAQLALASVSTPRSESENWRVWLPLNAYRTRQALIDHPNLIPIMLRRVPMGIGNEVVEASVARLQAEGLPLGATVPLIESLEVLAISSALQYIGAAKLVADDEVGVRTPTLAKAYESRALSNDEMFEIVVASVLSSVENAVYLREARSASDMLDSGKH